MKKATGIIQIVAIVAGSIIKGILKTIAIPITMILCACFLADDRHDGRYGWWYYRW